MRIEHVALNVSDPLAVADWYAMHLGAAVVRQGPPPVNMRFIADASGNVILELYSNLAAPVPDYASQDPLVLHIAFRVDDITAERDRLLGAGATLYSDVDTLDNGDQLAMLRDPWGLAIQLAHRAEPML
jgi:glyoxylase I family protein